jgi:hypothetical protein
MFKRGDKVQFSKYGQRGLKGYVREVQPGKIKVEWVTRETSWERPDNLVRLPEERMHFAHELLTIARELLS